MRRLVNMAADPADAAWFPDLPPVEEFRDTFPISVTTSYVVRYALDKYNRVVDWAVVQRRNTDDGLRRVAVYDACHGKGVHVHLYNPDGAEVDEHPLHRAVASHADSEAGLDYATERVVKDWQENERRSGW